MSASCVQYHVHNLIAFVRVMIATPCPRITSRRRVAVPQRTHAAVSVTFTTRHAVTTGPPSCSWIGNGCSYSDSDAMPTHDLASACRHSPHTCDAMSVTFLSASRAQRHVRGLIAIVRILIAELCPRTTSCRRVIILRRTCAVVSASRAQRHIRDLIAVVRNLIAVACPRTTSCRRVAAP